MGEHFKAGNNLVINGILMSTEESLLLFDFSRGSISDPRSQFKNCCSQRPTS